MDSLLSCDRILTVTNSILITAYKVTFPNLSHTQIVCALYVLAINKEKFHTVASVAKILSQSQANVHADMMKCSQLLKNDIPLDENFSSDLAS